MNFAKKGLRKEQKASRLKREKAKEIMAAQNDSKVFYKLIRDQRKGSNPRLQTLTVSEVNRETPEEIRQGYATDFQILATPLENPSFDQKYKQMVDADVECIEFMCSEENSPIVSITEGEVCTAMKRLNNNKAADIMGLTSEHFKLASF